MKFFVAIAAAVALSGCTTLKDSPGQAQFPVQYATLKVIQESDEVSRADVIEHVERARAVLDAGDSVSIDELMTTVDLSGLDPADRMLIGALLAQIEHAASDVDVVGEERRVRLMTLLDWIEQAASYANTDS